MVRKITKSGSSEGDAVKVHLELKQNNDEPTLIVWEEGQFPIGFIDEYETACQAVEALLVNSGIKYEVYTDLKMKDKDIDVILTRASNVQAIPAG